MRARVKGCEQKDGGGWAVAKQVTRVIGIWADGVGDWSGSDEMPDWILP